jgi:hypothetical protein
MPPHRDVRAIVRAELARISDSCGYGVPLYRCEGERTQLGEWAARKGPEGLRDYLLEHGARGIDGLPALRAQRLGATGPR